MTVQPSTKLLEGLRVLYVEDDVLIAMNFVEILESLGAHVDERNTINTALSALEQSSYDLALLDVNLHGQMSYPIAQAALSKKMALVFVTGYGLEALAPEWQHCAMCEKPCSESEVRTAIEEALESRTAQR